MGNLFDYLDWRGDLSFSEVGFGEIDSLILSTIAYVDFDGIVPREHGEKSIALLAAARQYLRVHSGEQAYLGAILPPETLTLMVKAAKTRRFANLRLTGYENKVCADTELQFSAITYMLGGGNVFVAFRGTDDTLVGWKENFNMSFMITVPAQLEAVNYLRAAANAHGGDLYVGGHSKGGNLAVYSTVRSSPDVKERIKVTYNNDGPGFSDGFISAPEYQSVQSKIRTIIPQSSVVGMLLEHEERYEVVKSGQVGLLQHDPFSWEVLGGSFIYLNDITEESRRIDQTVRGWLSEMDMSQRESFVDAVYEALSSLGANTLTDISTDKLKLLRAWGKLDDNSKNIVSKTFKLLMKSSLKPKKNGK